MQVRAAVAREAGKPLSLETAELEGPREGEVLGVQVPGVELPHLRIPHRGDAGERRPIRKRGIVLDVVRALDLKTPARLRPARGRGRLRPDRGVGAAQRLSRPGRPGRG